MTDVTRDPVKIRLTSLSHGAGCACKLGPGELTNVLRHLPGIEDPNVLVDASTRDDAAVYRIAPDKALVVTLDFFTPIVDDPASWGAIAATIIHHLPDPAQAPELALVQRLPNPATFADVSLERALKVLLYQAPPVTPAG